MELSRLSKQKQAVVADAMAAGYAIEQGDFCVDLVKRSKHAKPRVLRGLRIYHDGYGFDLTVDLSVAKAIRAASDMRSILNLN